jgi:hypothetical protein
MDKEYRDEIERLDIIVLLDVISCVLVDVYQSLRETFYCCFTLSHYFACYFTSD